MADLSVDTAGLDSVAASGADVADALEAGSEVGECGGSQPSHAGIAAVRAAVTRARRAQSARGTEHAGRIDAASAIYRHTDDGSADVIATTI